MISCGFETNTFWNIYFGVFHTLSQRQKVLSSPNVSEMATYPRVYCSPLLSFPIVPWYHGAKTATAVSLWGQGAAKCLLIPSSTSAAPKGLFRVAPACVSLRGLGRGIGFGIYCCLLLLSFLICPSPAQLHPSLPAVHWEFFSGVLPLLRPRASWCWPLHHIFLAALLWQLLPEQHTGC